MLTKLFYNLLGFLFSRRTIKTLAWKYWYPYLTRRLEKSDVLFLNYAFVDETTFTPQLELQSGDEKNRAYINLYHHLARQVALSGKQILEVISRIFAGIKGTRIYLGLKKNDLVYRSYCLQRLTTEK